MQIMAISTVRAIHSNATGILRSDEPEMLLSGNQHSSWVWHEKKNAHTENNLYANMVEVFQCNVLLCWIVEGYAKKM